MKRYRLKIERKFQESAVNANFKMPLVAEPQKLRRMPDLSNLHPNINSQRSSSQVQAQQTTGLISLSQSQQVARGGFSQNSYQRFQYPDAQNVTRNSNTRISKQVPVSTVGYEDYGQFNNAVVFRNHNKGRDMTQTSSLREAINQQSQIFSLNSMSSKTIGLQQAID